MINQVAARGVFLALIALYFVLQAPALTIGRLNQPGPGLFPIMIGGLLLLIAVAIIIRSRFVEAIPLAFQVRNVAIIAASLVAFVVVTGHVNMLAGIAAMITIALMASDAYSIRRNIVVVVALCAAAYAMKRLLGVQLPLF